VVRLEDQEIVSRILDAEGIPLHPRAARQRTLVVDGFDPGKPGEPGRTGKIFEKSDSNK
jgi:hypothetical protein